MLTSHRTTSVRFSKLLGLSNERMVSFQITAEKAEKIYSCVQIILLMFLPAYICFQDKKKRL